MSAESNLQREEGPTIRLYEELEQGSRSALLKLRHDILYRLQQNNLPTTPEERHPYLALGSLLFERIMEHREVQALAPQEILAPEHYTDEISTLKLLLLFMEPPQDYKEKQKRSREELVRELSARPSFIAAAQSWPRHYSDEPAAQLLELKQTMENSVEYTRYHALIKLPVIRQPRDGSTMWVRGWHALQYDGIGHRYHEMGINMHRLRGSRNFLHFLNIAAHEACHCIQAELEINAERQHHNDSSTEFWRDLGGRALYTYLIKALYYAHPMERDALKNGNETMFMFYEALKEKGVTLDLPEPLPIEP